MSRINGEKSRAALQAKKRTAMRLKTRTLRAAAAAATPATKPAKKTRSSKA